VGNVTRSGLTVEVGHSDFKRLNRLATTTGLSKSELIGAALATLEGVGKVDAATAYRLDQLTRQLECLERDQTILIEMLALFIRDYLSGRAGDPEPQKEPARALGRVRFEHFIEQLVRHFQKGNSFLRDVEEGFASELDPEGSGKLRDAVPA
jgi:hypothetical protein